MSMHFPHPAQRASDVRATGGSVQSWKRRAPLDGTGLNVGVVAGAGKPFSNGPDEKLHRAVSPGTRQVVMVV